MRQVPGKKPRKIWTYGENIIFNILLTLYSFFYIKETGQVGSLTLEERRRNRRIQVRKKVRLKLPDIEDKPCGRSFCYSLSENISQGGIKIPSEYFLPVNQTILLDIFLEDSFGMVNARGEVRWVTRTNTENYEVGIEFKDLSGDSRSSLNKFCQLQN